MGKPNYEKSTAQLDLEARQKKDYVPFGTKVEPDEKGKSDDGFVNVDHVYHNAVQETDLPMKAEGGPEAKLESGLFTDDVDFSAGLPPEGESEADPEGEDDDKGSDTTNKPGQTPGSSTPPSGPAAPAQPSS